MRESTHYQNLLDTAIPLKDDEEKEALEKEMGFGYRNAIGEIMFLMVTCRPDISYATIKLSKFCNNPAREHYIAVKNIYRYLREKVDDRIIY